MKFRLMLKVLSVFLIAILLSGCAHIHEHKKQEMLEAKQKFFWKSLRWKSYSSALSVIKFKNTARKAFVSKGLEHITVTSYEEIGSVVVGDSGDIRTAVLFDYIQDETGRVFKIEHSELWWYEEESKQWYLGSDLPEFKTGR